MGSGTGAINRAPTVPQFNVGAQFIAPVPDPIAHTDHSIPPAQSPDRIISPESPQLPKRRSTRLKGYDYSRAGAYFITVCTQDQVCLFGEIVEGEMELSVSGTIVQDNWHEIPQHYAGIETDAFVVMPNHVHGVLLFEADGGLTLGSVVRGFKARVTRAIRDGHVWQRDFYDHVVRDQADLERIRAYIINNPAKWADDAENPGRPR